MHDPEYDLIERAADHVRRRGDALPSVAVTLGSGQAGLVEFVDVDWSLPVDELPGGRRPTALGHTGRLTVGRLDGRPLLLLEGRSHLYEGVSHLEATRPARLLQRLGVHMLLLTNAAGGLHPLDQVGDLAILDDCLNFTWSSPLQEWFPSAGPPVVACGRRVFDPGLVDAALAIARRHGITARRGVYAAVVGPNYETRAEWRAFHRLGADVIGMSTVGEAVVAARLGLRVAALSTITNCCRPDAPEATDGHLVVANAHRAVDCIRTILSGLLAESAVSPASAEAPQWSANPS